MRSDGRAVCWGENWGGVLFAPSEDSFSVVTSGNMFSCGVRIDGLIRCWGSNLYGQAPRWGATF
ncbi:BNR repeat domain protein [Vulgatibacter incomptus]|uniref:BNR repeat domain protein n=1 Tax=Vulgatibacter incomptus TaxID=1391653 RepID=A0A0K1PDH1_9BACT|nr:BNR repeat domain protein [Vulgatibacter incomptus]